MRELASDVKAKSLRIAQLEARIARLKRLQFGRSSEKLAREIEQLELALDELHEDDGVHAVERPAVVQAILEKAGAPAAACTSAAPGNGPCVRPAPVPLAAASFVIWARMSPRFWNTCRPRSR